MTHSTKHCVTESVQCIILGGSLSPATSKEVTGNRKNCLINVKLITLKVEEPGMQKTALA